MMELIQIQGKFVTRVEKYEFVSEGKCVTLDIKQTHARENGRDYGRWRKNDEESFWRSVALLRER